MTFTHPNSLIFFTKTSLLGLAVASLLASGTTSGGAVMGGEEFVQPKIFKTSIVRNNANTSSAFKNTEVTLTQNSSGDISMTLDGKSYAFTSADLHPGETQLYYKDFGDLGIILQNSSVRNFEGVHDFKTSHVSVWYVGIDNSVTNVTDRGTVIIGDVSASIPTSDAKVFEGRLEGYEVVKSSNTEYFLDGTARFAADFSGQTISGGFYNIRRTLAGSSTPNAGDYSIDIVDGRISGSGFEGKLRVTENSQNVAVSNDALKASFYGENAAESAGSGQFETDTSRTGFTFIAK